MIKIGVILRYDTSDVEQLVLYERTRRCFSKLNVQIKLISHNMDESITKDNMSNSNIKYIYKELESCDALFLQGGNKTCNYNLKIIEMALLMKMPILGVCLGMQEFLKLFGARTNFIKEKFINHIEHFDESYKNPLYHDIQIEKGSTLHNLFGDNIIVNSLHKAFVEEDTIDLKKFKIVAKSKDGIVEAVEYLNYDFCILTQFHPETMILKDNSMLKLFNLYFKKAKIYKNKKNICKKEYINKKLLNTLFDYNLYKKISKKYTDIKYKKIIKRFDNSNFYK